MNAHTRIPMTEALFTYVQYILTNILMGNTSLAQSALAQFNEQDLNQVKALALTFHELADQAIPYEPEDSP